MAKRLTKLGKELLLAAAAGTQMAPHEFDNTSAPYKELAELDYLRVAQTEHAAGKVYGILSEAGADRAKTFDKSEDGPRRPPVDPSQFAVRTPDVAPMPEFARRGGAGQPALYPFETVGSGPIGGSFFVPASEAKPEPWKSFNSTVSSQNAKARKQFDEDKAANRDPKPAPQFRLSTSPEDFNGTKGAGVYLVSHYSGPEVAAS